jgi:protein-glutamine gamma-glutamyltransferase
MIQVAGMPLRSNAFEAGSVEKEIIQRMLNARDLYSYSSFKELLFEISTRKNIIESAKEMNKGDAAFTTFQYTQCNTSYWKLTKEGGFLLKPNVSPSNAILDIFKNSSLYAFECATACIITFYHAVLISIRKPFFQSLFRDIYLYSWQADPDLGIHTFYGNHYLPGDVVYFDNPDFHSETPWYRGINAVVMSDGQFFGHGLGIKSDDEIIKFLNSQRQPESTKPAYLANLVTRPSFKLLSAYSI